MTPGWFLPMILTFEMPCHHSFPMMTGFLGFFYALKAQYVTFAARS